MSAHDLLLFYRVSRFSLLLISADAQQVHHRTWLEGEGVKDARVWTRCSRLSRVFVTGIVEIDPGKLIFGDALRTRKVRNLSQRTRAMQRRHQRTVRDIGLPQFEGFSVDFDQIGYKRPKFVHSDKTIRAVTVSCRRSPTAWLFDRHLDGALLRVRYSYASFSTFQSGSRGILAKPGLMHSKRGQRIHR